MNITMRISTIIGTLIISTSTHNLNAMAQHKENIKRLSDNHAATDHKDESEGQPALATISLDGSPKNKPSIDPVTEALYKTIIDRKHQEKFIIFLQDFRKQAGEIWKDHKKQKKR